MFRKPRSGTDSALPVAIEANKYRELWDSQTRPQARAYNDSLHTRTRVNQFDFFEVFCLKTEHHRLLMIWG